MLSNLGEMKTSTCVVYVLIISCMSVCCNWVTCEMRGVVGELAGEETVIYDNETYDISISAHKSPKRPNNRKKERKRKREKRKEKERERRRRRRRRRGREREEQDYLCIIGKCMFMFLCMLMVEYSCVCVRVCVC